MEIWHHIVGILYKLELPEENQQVIISAYMYLHSFKINNKHNLVCVKMNVSPSMGIHYQIKSKSNSLGWDYITI